MRQPIEIAEVLAWFAVWRQRLEVERREHAHTRDSRDVRGVFARGAVAFGDVTREEDHHGVERRRRQRGVPAIRMAGARESEQLRTLSKSLAKLFGKGAERCIVDA